MATDELKIRRILDQLYMMLSIGWRDFMIAKYIQEAQSTRKIRSGFGFFQGSYEACIDIACLNIAKVLIKDVRGKPANIWYLLNYLQGNPDALQGANKKIILGCVTQHLHQLEGLEETISKIERQRHYLVHIDKRRVNNPIKLYKYTGVIDENDLNKAYHLAFDVIATYKGYLKPTEDISVLFDYWSSMIKDDIEFIVERANQKENLGRA